MNKKRSKEIGKESHVYKDDGELAGLYTIDGFKVREAFGNKKFWQGADEIVRLYTQLNPNEMQVAATENAATKAGNFNDLGTNDSKSMRQALNIPYALYLVLIDYELTLLRNKKTRSAFMKRYPMLRTCNQV